jgi:hypothetical protein
MSSSAHLIFFSLSLSNTLNPTYLIFFYLIASFKRVTKLASLFVKTLAKPLSKRIKHEFSRYAATQRVLIGIGQASHQVSSRMTIWSAGYKVREIKPLEDENAMKTGAEFIGEFFILLVSGTTVVLEYNRSKAKDLEKEEKRIKASKAERDALQAALHKLDLRVKELERQLAEEPKEKSSSVLVLEKKKWGLW